VRVKEIFYSIQGEGINAGRPAVFCRFTGCNLWSGHEQDRANAVCRFCDTDFVGGRAYHEDDLVRAIVNEWEGCADIADCAAGNKDMGRPLVIFTGGEPGLQVTDTLIDKMRRAYFNVAIETNGTVRLPPGTYHVTVSPKFGSDVILKHGNELKVVWPQPFDLDELASWSFRHYFLQPMDGVAGAVEQTVETVLRNPKWRLSLQTHKILGVR